VSCHGAGKQKGGLRLDNPADLLRGGDSGAVILSGQPDQSELIRRCQLPEGHEEHMPPKGKPALSSAELEILQWWISLGTPVNMSVQEASPAPPIRKLFDLWCKDGRENAPEPSLVPDENPIACITGTHFKAETGRGVRYTRIIIISLAEGEPGQSSAACRLCTYPADRTFTSQLLTLDLSRCSIPAALAGTLSRFTQLTTLSLAGTEHHRYSNVCTGFDETTPRAESVWNCCYCCRITRAHFPEKPAHSLP
jgi:hypothetical protein